MSTTHTTTPAAGSGADRSPFRFPTSWWPTRKWMAGLVTAVGGLLVNWITAGEMTKEIKIAAISVAVTAVVSYLTPNAMTPGGYRSR